MTSLTYLRLGVNIDHVATIRNARGGQHPDPVKAALLAIDAGADGITAHLREDRRHIRDEDISRLMDEISMPLNFEMAPTEEMLDIALKHQPNACCLVPEKRQELTTEGGLDLIGNETLLVAMIEKLKEANIRVSLFIDADQTQIKKAAELQADIIELHTGTYCHEVTDKEDDKVQNELSRIKQGAELADQLGLEVHAGHGITFESVGPIAAIPQLVELNIGHFIISEAIFVGLSESIKKMREHMDAARQ